MNRLHATGVAVLLAAAAVLGAVAVVGTTGLGTAARKTNDAAFAAREARLVTAEARLRQALRARPPALPPVPKVPKAVSHPSTASAPAAAPVQRVIYRRPAPVVHVVHTHHGDDGGEHGDGGGGGGDD